VPINYACHPNSTREIGLQLSRRRGPELACSLMYKKSLCAYFVMNSVLYRSNFELLGKSVLARRNAPKT